MHSNQIENISSWHSFNDERVLDFVPKDRGIYIIRRAEGRTFGRLRGESDILYIGSAKGGLKKRLRQYFHPGRKQWTNIRINALMKKYPMEVAWRLHDQPRNLELELLYLYEKDHDELPPYNRQSLRKIYAILGIKYSLRIDELTEKMIKSLKEKLKIG